MVIFHSYFSHYQRVHRMDFTAEASTVADCGHPVRGTQEGGQAQRVPRTASPGPGTQGSQGAWGHQGEGRELEMRWESSYNWLVVTGT